jgi:hypothetical protein
MPSPPQCQNLTDACTKSAFTYGMSVIACDVLSQELQLLAPSRLRSTTILQQGLHNDPPLLRKRLQETIDTVEREHKPGVIALVYGLCSRGIEAVTTEHAYLVAPRAHDCITLLLGDRKRYADYAREHPGTYWYSPGWNRCHLPPGPQRFAALRQKYVEKFGEDEADFLMESEQQWFSSYSRATFVDLGLSDTHEDQAHTRSCADWLKWSYDRQHGDPKLLRDLLTGPWDEDRFAIAPPGHGFRMTADDSVMRVEVTVKGQDLK